MLRACRYLAGGSRTQVKTLGFLPTPQRKARGHLPRECPRVLALSLNWHNTGNQVGFYTQQCPCGWRHLNLKHSLALCVLGRALNRSWAPRTGVQEDSPNAWQARGASAAFSEQAHAMATERAALRRIGDRAERCQARPGCPLLLAAPGSAALRPCGLRGGGESNAPFRVLRPAGQPRSSSGRESSLPRPSRSRAPAPGPAPGGNPRLRLPLPAASARLPDPWGPGRPHRQRPGPTAHYDIFLPGLRRLRRHREPDTARLAPANPGARHRPSDGSIHQ